MGGPTSGVLKSNQETCNHPLLEEAIVQSDQDENGGAFWHILREKEAIIDEMVVECDELQKSNEDRSDLQYLNFKIFVAHSEKNLLKKKEKQLDESLRALERKAELCGEVVD